MYGLLIDTSSSRSFACLCKNRDVLFTTELPFGKDLSKVLFPSIEALLSKGEIQIGDLSYIGVGIGPGSYTGTRSGSSAAQSLAFAKNIPLLPFCSLLSFVPENFGEFFIYMQAKNGMSFGMDIVKQEDRLTYTLHPNLSKNDFTNLSFNKTLIEISSENLPIPSCSSIIDDCLNKIFDHSKNSFDLSLFYLHTP